MTVAATPNYLPKVREQYEALPYPPIEIGDEYKRLVSTQTDPLDYLNHRFYGGRQTFREFRVLSAGDGTGNASIFLAEQLYEFGGEVVAIDMSSASQHIAKERAKIRGLNNITFLNESLLDIPKLGLGAFDYVSCSGVLHHLASPETGLRTLVDALKPGGLLGIMVYAQTGRTGIYYMQALLNELLDKKNDPIDEQIELTRTIISQLPQSNWLWHMPEHSMYDINHYGDSGIFDLLLHTQDRAYTVPQIYEWVEQCGAQMAEFIFHDNHQDNYYNPMRYILDADFTAEAEKLSLREQQHVADLLAGMNNKHMFYATKGPVPQELSPDDTSLIPSIAINSPLLLQYITDAVDALRSAKDGREVSVLTIPGRHKPLLFTSSQTLPDFLQAIDGKRSIGHLIAEVMKKHPDLTPDELSRQFRTFYDECRTQLILTLRHPDGARLPDIMQMHQRGLKRGQA